MCAKFDQNTSNSWISIVFAGLFPYLSIVTLTFDVWPWNQYELSSVSSWAMFDKFDQSALKGLA